LGFILLSCTIDETLNDSPNAANEESAKTVDGVYGLSISLQVAASDFYSSDRSRITSIFTWQMCAPPGLGRPQPVGWNTYNMTEDGPPDDVWKLTGYRGIKITTDIIAFAPEVFAGLPGTKEFLLGMAKTYRAMFFGEMAALYGSIPIDLNGLEPAKFATQRQAYDKVQTLLTEALGHFAAVLADENYKNYARDLNHKGNATVWTEIVHSLKARYHLHVGEYSQALTEATSGISVPENSLFGIHTASAGEYSPWGHWTNTEVGEPIRCEAFYMRMLKAESGDNRIAEYFNPNEDGDFYGFAVHSAGSYNPAPEANELDPVKTCHLKKYGAYDANFPAVSYEENLLIAAECKARTGDVPGAVIDVNVIRTAAGLTDFASSDPVATVTEVLKQKYLELFLEGQAYHDMRRTGSLPESAVPYRWIYPQSEKNANPNYKDVQTNDKSNDPFLVKWVLNKKYGGDLD
jgi:hypothetical protein